MSERTDDPTFQDYTINHWTDAVPLSTGKGGLQGARVTLLSAPESTSTEQQSSAIDGAPGAGNSTNTGQGTTTSTIDKSNNAIDPSVEGFALIPAGPNQYKLNLYVSSPDALKLNENGDLSDSEKARNEFGGDAALAHLYMMKTNPTYRERHESLMRMDHPAQNAFSLIDVLGSSLVKGTTLLGKAGTLALESATGLLKERAKDDIIQLYNSRKEH